MSEEYLRVFLIFFYTGVGWQSDKAELVNFKICTMKIMNFYEHQEQDFQQLFVAQYQDIRTDIVEDIKEVEADILMANLVEDYIECVNLNGVLATLKCVKRQYDLLIQKNLN
jgi:hypothetical protein